MQETFSVAMTRRIFVAAGLATGLLAPGASRAGEDALYSAQVIVTGRDNLSERARGIRAALPLVLAKVSGDAEVAARAETAGAMSDAAAMVGSLDYLDRKEGIQISDEQGTRDRSFILTVHFLPDRIDALLARLGARAWTGARPEIGLALLIDDGRSRYLLTRTSASGYGQRLVVDDVARDLALPVRLPEAAAAEDPAVAQAAAIATAPLRLTGRMQVTPDGFWNAEWHLAGSADGKPVARDFNFSHVSFDIAIGDALKGTARSLAMLSK